VKSGKEAKRLIAENGAKLNDEALTDGGLMITAEALSSPIKLSAGKKTPRFGATGVIQHQYVHQKRAQCSSYLCPFWF
jgi:hypothetical protein